MEIPVARLMGKVRNRLKRMPAGAALKQVQWTLTEWGEIILLEATGIHCEIEVRVGRIFLGPGISVFFWQVGRELSEDFEDLLLFNIFFRIATADVGMDRGCT